MSSAETNPVSVECPCGCGLVRADNPCPCGCAARAEVERLRAQVEAVRAVLDLQAFNSHAFDRDEQVRRALDGD